MSKKLKAVEEIRTRSAEIFTRHEAALARIDKEIAEASEAIRKAEEARAKAKEEHNETEFIKASEDLDKARNSKQIRENWRRDTEREELISKEEYLELVKKAQEEIKEVAAVYQEYFIKMADQTFNKSDELLEMIRETNSALSLLQNDLYRNQDRRKGPNGNMLFLNQETKQVDPRIWTIAEYGRTLGMSYFYKEVTGAYRK